MYVQLNVVEIFRWFYYWESVAPIIDIITFQKEQEYNFATVSF